MQATAGNYLPFVLVLQLLVLATLVSSVCASAACEDGATSARAGQLCDDSCPCDATAASVNRHNFMVGAPQDLECRSTSAGQRCMPANAAMARGDCGNPGQACCADAPCVQNPNAKVTYTCQVCVAPHRPLDVCAGAPLSTIATIRRYGRTMTRSKWYNVHAANACLPVSCCLSACLGSRSVMPMSPCMVTYTVRHVHNSAYVLWPLPPESVPM